MSNMPRGRDDVRFIFYAPFHFERWDYRNPDDPGIGGSETHVVEMAKRLAARGYEVHCQIPVREDTEDFKHSVYWWPIDGFELDSGRKHNIVVNSRAPQDAGKLQWADEQWIICQDEDYTFYNEDIWPENAAYITRVVALCPQQHMHLMGAHGDSIGDKLCLSTNGVRVDLLEELESAGNWERDPNKAMYFSSPDRGLMHAIAPNWHRVRELHPDAELHAYYGWDNIENAMDNSDGFVDPKVRRLYDRFRDLKQEEGIVWHGRTGQRALYGDLLTASVWPYWSDFKETSCIACQEAQCAGLFPITRPVWAVGDNVRYGVFYHGSAWSEGYSLSSAIAWTATALGDRAYQEALRPAMMVNSRFRFDWERVVDQYELWARGIEFKTNINDDHGLPLPWHAYQILESHGDILNVGCHTDSAMFKENHGDRCTNLDTAHEDPNMPGVELPVDVIGDGRNLDFPNDRFDTVVLGEVLKHMKEKDAKKTLKEARRVAKDRVVVTVPADTRTRDEQDAVRRSLGWTEPTKNYVGGISGYHIKQWDWTDILKTAGKGAHALGTPRVVRNPYGKGWGLVINGS